MRMDCCASWLLQSALLLLQLITINSFIVTFQTLRAIGHAQPVAVRRYCASSRSRYAHICQQECFKRFADCVCCTGILMC